jgi:hypothetical protein
MLKDLIIGLGILATAWGVSFMTIYFLLGRFLVDTTSDPEVLTR